MRRQLVDFVQQTKVYNHLKAVTEMVQLDSSGIFYLQYKKDWDDAKVGAHFGYSRLQIKDFRRKHVGKENPGGAGKPHSRMAMIKRIDELEGRLLKIEEYLGALDLRGVDIGKGNGQ